MKKLSKAEMTFHRDIKEKIDRDATESTPTWWGSSTPIFIPKRKKFKR
jgi:hypothetical protein